MEFKGEFVIKRDRAAVLSFISDINRITSIIPDVQSKEIVSEKSARLVVKAGQSAIKGKFNLLFEIGSIMDGQSAEISAKGSGAGGSLDLKARYSFLDLPESSTLVKWVVELKIGGVIATMGSRVLNGTAEKYIAVLTDSFVKSLEK
ncbi:MAG: SRPBCC domain-containing protein [Candidatus Thermoplasmatota archaeon]|jgi:carbon monoxide dehydrogenase subunit G|nr:SRPBCC domain-containing protein [Candidatus Thermoplasmatota archaeon]